MHLTWLALSRRGQGGQQDADQHGDDADDDEQLDQRERLRARRLLQRRDGVARMSRTMVKPPFPERYYAGPGT